MYLFYITSDQGHLPAVFLLVYRPGVISQGYYRFRLFWKYAEIGYFVRLKLFPFQGLTRVHFSLFSENNGFLNIYMFKSIYVD